MRSRNLQHDQSGLAAVEFAIILPIMLLLFLGSFETTNLVLAYMKLEASADGCRSGCADQSKHDSSEHGFYQHHKCSQAGSNPSSDERDSAEDRLCKRDL
jgi:hypothetical protein